MSESFKLTVAAHEAFGALATLWLMGQPERRFTLQEAAIVARALEAVAQGRSLERQIYLSPIASDHDFDARASAAGFVVACAGYRDVGLDHAAALALAKALEAAAGAASNP